jgi:fructose-bisphosphate aldolase, class II
VTLAAMPALAARARDTGRGLGAFNVIQLEHAEAIVRGAEQAGLPVVLQISENTAAYHGSLAPLALAVLRVAQESSADVVVHLDHATRPELVREAVELGVPSVMIDASTLPHARNTLVTGELTAWCHDRGVWVEAELGEVGGKDGAHAPGVRTDPAAAADFVAATAVDALAVAVGSSHAMLTRDARLDDDLIATIAARVPVPLVLHGSSGVPDAGLSSAVDHGIVKVNIATHLNKAMTGAVRDVLAADPAVVDPRKYLGPARAEVAAEVARLLDVLALPARRLGTRRLGTRRLGTRRLGTR